MKESESLGVLDRDQHIEKRQAVFVVRLRLRIIDLTVKGPIRNCLEHRILEDLKT